LQHPEEYGVTGRVRGELELLAPSTHPDTSKDTKTRSEQAGWPAQRQPGDIKDQLDASASVSREISRPPAADLLDALAAVREALDIPNGATMGDEEIRDKIFMERARHAMVMLRGILGEDATRDTPWSVGYLRERPDRASCRGLQDLGRARCRAEGGRGGTRPGWRGIMTAERDPDQRGPWVTAEQRHSRKMFGGV
jgi:uncharacterized alpha-E superfamily protein